MDSKSTRVLALISVLLSCASVPEYVNSKPAQLGTLHIWVQPDPVITANLVLDGCRFWEPVGVKCEIVQNPAKADVVVSVSYEPCLSLARKRVAATKTGAMAGVTALRPECKAVFPKDEDITEAWSMLGLSTMAGQVTLYPMCMSWAGGGIVVPDMVRRTAAHEVGHELGINHVPLSCNDNCVQYELDAAGAKLCGPAIMNAPIVDAMHITPIDADAFRRPNTRLFPNRQ